MERADYIGLYGLLAKSGPGIKFGLQIGFGLNRKRGMELMENGPRS